MLSRIMHALKQPLQTQLHLLETSKKSIIVLVLVIEFLQSQKGLTQPGKLFWELLPFWSNFQIFG